MEKYTDHPLEKEIIFSADLPGKFANLSAAFQWLDKNGYSYGDRQEDNPIAIQRGEYTLPRLWNDITAGDKKSLAGVLIPWGGFKYGNVRMRLFKPDFSRLQVDDIFPHAGRLYKVKADTAENIRVCSNCAFDKRQCKHLNCLPKDRPDGVPVVFVECNDMGEEIPRPPVISNVKREIIAGIKDIAEFVDHSPAHISSILEEYARKCCRASLKAAADNWEARRIDDDNNIVLL